MLDLKSPVITDREAVCEALSRAGYMGSDGCFCNLFLLRKKYGTLIDISGGFLFRYYHGKGSRRGYAFPLGKGSTDKALSLITADAKEHGRPLEFCFLTGEQAEILSRFFGSSLTLTKNRGDADYIYAAESLASLSGKQYQKKRNHISKFGRTYGDSVEIRPLTHDNFSDALRVEEMWLNGEDYDVGGNAADAGGQDNAAAAERSEDESSRAAEYNAIVEALNNFGQLGLKGAVLYVYGRPVAMTAASEIISGVWDIHFEKVIGEYAVNGGYSVINKLFAETLTGARLINREEDINIEGLRKAKLSYYPQLLLEKSSGAVKANDKTF